MMVETPGGEKAQWTWRAGAAARRPKHGGVGDIALAIARDSNLDASALARDSTRLRKPGAQRRVVRHVALLAELLQSPRSFPDEVGGDPLI